jgi:hypothetical protein
MQSPLDRRLVTILSNDKFFILDKYRTYVAYEAGLLANEAYNTND